MKRVAQGTSAASSAKRSSATGSRSMPISVPDGPKAVGDEAGVPAAADGAVDGRLARVRREQVDQLARQHRHVDRGHVKENVSRLAVMSVIRSVRSGS